MRRFDRRTMGAAVASMAAAALTTERGSAKAVTRRYVGHAARLTAEIPITWSVDPSASYEETGDDGFVVSEPVAGSTLDEAASTLAASWRFDGPATVTPATWAGASARRVVGRSGGADAVSVVVPHPRPFETWGEAFAFAAVTTGPAHHESIVATIDFAPDRVSPNGYFASVLDIVKARAYWAGDVDWDLTRRVVAAEIDGLATVEEARAALVGIHGTLRAAGDNHSFLVLAGAPDPLARDGGTGMLVGGTRVVAVFPNGPADRAGIVLGESVEAADGEPLAPTLQAIDPGSLWPPMVELTLRRDGAAEAVVITVEQGPYDTYLPPTGRRLSDEFGYVAVPHFYSWGRETAFAVEADRIVAAVDERPTRGWVVDLRLNRGGSYTPMVTGIGAILGNARFVGWRSAEGRQSWVSYEDGRITQDGREVSDHLKPDGPTALHRPNPPVAVLVGPSTASSGEVTTLAFVGRPATRLFGERTGGYTTSNVGHHLFDGSYLGLAVAAMTDRTGATHLPGIEPDEPVPTDWTTFGTPDDPVIAAAVAWLRQQPPAGWPG